MTTTTTALLIAAPFVVAPVTFVLGVLFGRAIDRVDDELAPPYDELFPPPVSGPWDALPDRFPPLSGPPRELQLNPFQIHPVPAECPSCHAKARAFEVIYHDDDCELYGMVDGRAVAIPAVPAPYGECRSMPGPCKRLDGCAQRTCDRLQP